MKTDVNKKTLLRFAAFMLAFCCIFSSLIYSAPRVSADEELDDLQQQYNDLEEKINKNKQELSEVQGEIKDKKKTLNTINSEIDDINSQINILESRISTLNSDIANKENNIEKLEQDIKDINAQIDDTRASMEETRSTMQGTRETLMGRIRENYMTGETSTLEVLFTSEDLESYFTRMEIMQRVAESDTALIDDLTEKLAQLEELEVELNNKKTELEGKIVELEEQKTALDSRKDDLKSSRSTEQSKKSEVTKKKQQVQSIINELDHDSAEYKAEIKRQQAEKEQLSKQIDAYIAAHGSSIGDTPNATYENDGKMAWPVKFESYITAGYPSYSDGSPHWGIDICAVGGNTRGRAFNAAQGGEVIIAVNDGNWNYGFGNYCVIDHGDGTQTLYAHSDNIQVSVGQVVKKGDQIGIIGATGNVTGPHLHFEVRVKQADGSVSRVNPLSYVHNPY